MQKKNKTKHFIFVKTSHQQREINTYTGEIILEPMFEWESYLEQMIIYDHSDIDFYEENFKNLYKMLRPIFKESDDIRKN